MHKLPTFFSKIISVYAIFNGQSFNDTLTNDIYVLKSWALAIDCLLRLDMNTYILLTVCSGV